MSQQVKKKLSAAEKFAVRVAKNPAANQRGGYETLTMAFEGMKPAGMTRNGGILFVIKGGRR